MVKVDFYKTKKVGARISLELKFVLFFFELALEIWVPNFFLVGSQAEAKYLELITSLWGYKVFPKHQDSEASVLIALGY